MDFIQTITGYLGLALCVAWGIVVVGLFGRPGLTSKAPLSLRLTGSVAMTIKVIGGYMVYLHFIKGAPEIIHAVGSLTLISGGVLLATVFVLIHFF